LICAAFHSSDPSTFPLLNTGGCYTSLDEDRDRGYHDRSGL
jgi:hypothetical protein